MVFEGCRTANPTKYTRVFLSGTTKKIQILPLEELRPPRGTLPGVAGEREKKKKNPGPANTLLEPFELNE